ncbi:potassium transporter [Clavulina sp. PMI_390]|nr:potassium transporter [Clavulina sp. PMI_390]
MDKVISMEEGGGKVLRRPVVVSGVGLLFMCFSTLGVIYSDIGTSPLYVLNGIWSASGPAPSAEDVIGGCSAILWSLFLLPTVKYCFIALSFGEGGTFAMLQGLYPKQDTDEEDRSLTADSNFRSKSFGGDVRGRTFLTAAKWPLTVWSLFGTALTLSDGIFTPAVSVTSAVGGIAVAKPSIEKNITAISIAFLVALFLVQRFGTHRITAVFAPVTFAWLLLLAGTGIYNITYYPGIFRAIDPSRAIMWFVRTKHFDALAGVLLAVTGCEAMFANLGQFNAASIKLAFSCFVFPSLCLAYLGQGSRLIHDGDAVMSNIFFNTIPGPVGGGLYWVIFVFSILATLIASQALITATFSLIQQLVNYKSLPPFRLRYTNEKMQGQVYIPVANWVLCIATVVVVAVFKNLANMSNAYGFAVATVMIVTSTFIAIQIYCVKHLPIVVSFLYFVPFVFLDGIFWGASLRKVPTGAWVPLMIGSILTILMAFWTWARGLEDEFDGKNRKNPRHFLLSAGPSRRTMSPAPEEKDGVTTFTGGEVAEDLGVPTLSHRAGTTGSAQDDVVVSDALTFVDDEGEGEMTVVRLPTAAIFHKITAGKGVPHAFYGWVKHMPALPRLVIFLSVKLIPLAHVGEEDRYIITRVRSIKGFYGVTYCVGFRDDFNPSTEKIVQLASELEGRADPANAIRIIADFNTIAKKTTHIIPHHYVISKHINFTFASAPRNWIRRILIEEIYRRLVTMFPDTANWTLDNADILRVGVNAPI